MANENENQTMTPEEAQAELDRLTTENKSTLDRIDELKKLAAPDKAKPTSSASRGFIR